MQSLSEVPKNKKWISQELGVKYTFLDNRDITLIADGYPINFYESESVNDNEIAFIIAMLYEASKFLILHEGQITSEIISMNTDQDNMKLRTLQDSIKKRHEMYQW